MKKELKREVGRVLLVLAMLVAISIGTIVNINVQGALATSVALLVASSLTWIILTILEKIK